MRSAVVLEYRMNWLSYRMLHTSKTAGVQAEDALERETRGTSGVAPMRAGMRNMQHALAIIN